MTILEQNRTKIRQREIFLELPLSAVQNIKEDALRMPAPVNNIHTRNFLTASKRSVYKHLPQGLLSVFDDIKSGRITPTAIFIVNAPIDEILPFTPKDGKWSPLKKTFVSEFTLAGFMQLLGVPFGISGEKDGKLWSQNVVAEGREFDRSSLGAKVKLGFHSELAALTEIGLRCDWLGLIALRPDKARQAITNVVDVRDILPSLSPEQIEILTKPYFKYKIPNSFAFNKDFSSPMPILIEGNPYQMNINFSAGMCSFVDNNIEASQAYEWMDFVLETADIVRGFKLDEGNMLIINNLWGAHGRSVFEPGTDENGRWLQRMYVKADLFLARNRASKSDYLIYN